MQHSKIVQAQQRIFLFVSCHYKVYWLQKGITATSAIDKTSDIIPDLIPFLAAEPRYLDHGHVYGLTRCRLCRVCQPDLRFGVWRGLPGKFSDCLWGGGLALHGAGGRGVFLPLWPTGRAQPRRHSYQWLPLWGRGSRWAKANKCSVTPFGNRVSVVLRLHRLKLHYKALIVTWQHIIHTICGF